MRIKEYLSMDRNQLRFALGLLSNQDRAKFDAKLAMHLELIALQGRIDAKRALNPTRIMPAFTLADGKTVQPERKLIKCKTYRANI